ncbi:MAG: nucleotidyl transferase AbiEii/AbiGii toxin family protein [Candidatus Cloacimonadaceae bacterium]|nr:nucleotidyl transferase AbiEii/AbiGii toxin family protein [Candidatus Cloacimonadaceae bacterium]
MNISATDYQALYRLQDQAIAVLSDVLGGFYLTGGTALDRFYLHHRYSDDLDFFINAADDFKDRVNKIFRKLKSSFVLDESLTLEAETYTRFYIAGLPKLKIEVVNDVPERWGASNKAMGIDIDNPANILSNKLGCIMSRDEPKDVFDIIVLAETYSFNWKDVYTQAISKQITNETDIAMRLNSFPVHWLEDVPWIKKAFNPKDISAKLNKIADDLLFARDNSLGLNKPKIENAVTSQS